MAAFHQGLQETGWIVGRTVRIDYRWSSAGDAEQARKYAAELIALAPEVILAVATATVGPLQQATRTNPLCSCRWLGLVPRQNSTGGKHRLGGISKRGNPYLRRLLINGASANLLRSKATKADPWVIGLRRRRPPLVVAVALANKTARIAWAVMHRHENYQRVAAAA